MGSWAGAGSHVRWAGAGSRVTFAPLPPRSPHPPAAFDPGSSRIGTPPVPPHHPNPPRPVRPAHHHAPPIPSRAPALHARPSPRSAPPQVTLAGREGAQEGYMGPYELSAEPAHGYPRYSKRAAGGKTHWLYRSSTSGKWLADDESGIAKNRGDVASARAAALPTEAGWCGGTTTALPRPGRTTPRLPAPRCRRARPPLLPPRSPAPSLPTTATATAVRPRSPPQVRPRLRHPPTDRPTTRAAGRRRRSVDPRDGGGPAQSG